MGNHPLLFIIGAGALASALAIDLRCPRTRAKKRDGVTPAYEITEHTYNVVVLGAGNRP